MRQKYTRSREAQNIEINTQKTKVHTQSKPIGRKKRLRVENSAETVLRFTDLGVEVNTKRAEEPKIL